MLTLTEIVGAIVLELVLVGAIWGCYYYYKRNNLKSKLLNNALDSLDESMIRAMLIESQITRVKKRIASLTANIPDAEQKRALYTHWLEWLASEQYAWDESAQNKGKGFWGLFESKALALIEATQGDSSVVVADDAALDELRNKLAESKAELTNLARFRGLFFDLKNQLKDLQTDYVQLQLELQKALTGSDQQALQALNEQLKSKNQQLQNQLAAIDADFESLFAASNLASSANVAVPVIQVERFEKVDQGILKIKNVVAAQNLEIGEMNKLINNLQIELEERNKLLKKMREFEARSVEMETVIEVLEEENTYFQGQLKTFQGATRGNIYDLEDKVDRLTEELKEKEAARHKLQQNYNDLESEYLEVYQKLQEKKA